MSRSSLVLAFGFALLMAACGEVGGGDPIPLKKKTLLVGRRESCDITLRFPNVSAHHCQLQIDAGYWFVHDQKSRNGLKVNGTRVTYTPNFNFFGTDSFSYVVFGNAGTSAAAVITVTVIGRPDPTRDAQVQVSYLRELSGPLNQSLVVPKNGRVTIDVNGGA